VPLGPDVSYSLPPEPEIKALDLPDYEFSGVTVRHRVRAGDNLGRIARRYHVSVNQLCRWNRITGHTLLRPGRVLVVSRPRPVIETAKAAAPVISPVATAGPALVNDTSQAAPRAATEGSLAAPDTAKQALPQAAVPVSPPQPKPEAPPMQPAQQAAASAARHVVEIGETAFSISRKYGLTIARFASLNGLDVLHPVVKIGQALLVKGPGM
jgi:LysM repeat protein